MRIGLGGFFSSPGGWLGLSRVYFNLCGCECGLQLIAWGVELIPTSKIMFFIQII